MAEALNFTGATIVGLVYDTGVVLAGEKRVALGNYLLSKTGKKVFKVLDNIGIASAGLLADMQAISKILAAELKLKGGREIKGILKSYDIHMNLILQEAEEIQKDGNTRKLGTLIIRGDNVIMISPA